MEPEPVIGVTPYIRFNNVCTRLHGLQRHPAQYGESRVCEPERGSSAPWGKLPWSTLGLLAPATVSPISEEVPQWQRSISLPVQMVTSSPGANSPQGHPHPNSHLYQTRRRQTMGADD